MAVNFRMVLGNSMRHESVMTYVKICGITCPEDASMAVSLGARALGFIFYKGSPRFISLTQARAIIESLPPFVSTVALFVNSEAQDVVETIKIVKPDILQFHGEESASFCEQFERPYIKAIRVHKNTDLIQSCSEYSSAKAVLLDSFIVGKVGGSGVPFDWSLIPPSLSMPIILAGGLNSENVAKAVGIVGPWAVDVSSGVECSPGKKDFNKMLAFFQGVKNANE